MDQALTAALDSAPGDGDASSSGEASGRRWLEAEGLRPGGHPGPSLDDVTALAGAWATARGWPAPAAHELARTLRALGFRRGRHGRRQRRYLVAGRATAQRLADAARRLRDDGAPPLAPLLSPEGHSGSKVEKHDDDDATPR